MAFAAFQMNGGAVPSNQAPTLDAQDYAIVSPSGAPEPSVLSHFMRNFLELLEALSKIWPECDKLADKTAELRRVSAPGLKWLQEKVIKAYHEQMKDFYDACSARNAGPFLAKNAKIPSLLAEIDFLEKYDEVKDDPESVANLFDKINEINKYSRLYNQIPSRIVGKIEQTAAKIAEQLSSGQKDPKDLDIFEIGNHIVGGASPEEITDLMANMSSIFKAVGGESSMKSAMQAGVKTPNLGKLMEEMQRTQFKPEMAREVAQSVALGALPAAAGTAPSAQSLLGGTLTRTVVSTPNASNLTAANSSVTPKAPLSMGWRAPRE